MLVCFTLPGYIGPDYEEDAACPVWKALQDTAHTVADDGTVTTEPMRSDDPRAAALRAYPATEHAARVAGAA